jgi:hypothetical protein
MAAITVRGRIFPSFRNEELRNAVYPDYAVVYIEGSKLELFHIPWSTNVVVAYEEAIVPQEMNFTTTPQFYRLWLNENATLYYQDKEGKLKPKTIKNFELLKTDKELRFDASTGHSTSRICGVLPTFQTGHIDNIHLTKED